MGACSPAPIACEAAFLSPAERLDMLVDLGDVASGTAVLLETRAFDPMHARVPDDAVDAPPMAGHRPGAGTSASAAAAPAHDAWPEGAPRRLLTLRVRERVRSRGALPARSRASGPRRMDDAPERALRLGFTKGRWRINDRVFAMTETPIEATRDTREVWLLRNYHTSMPHAMHVHGFQFRVLERETSPDQVARARRRRAGPPRDRPRPQGHGAGLAGRERAHRDRLRPALPRPADLHVPLPQPRARGRRA